MEIRPPSGLTPAAPRPQPEPSLSEPGAWKVRQVRDGDQVELLGVEAVPADLALRGPVLLRSLPEHLTEDQPPSPGIYEETLYPADQLPEAELRFLEQIDPATGRPWPGSEVQTLVSQGPVGNRIDLTIVGDGYTAEERGRFFEDARRLTADLFQEKTFASYLPLFNVHAVFVPSKDSGVTDLTRKDTALGLYRSPQGSKRAVMPGKTGNIERALDLAPDTDFPILVANDDFYGGLGGRYAITTRSENSGSMVLRHELGHNFGNVGEEYDGGQVYSGANHSRSTSVPWKKWVEGGEAPVGKARNLGGSYPWKNLQGAPVNLSFDVPKAADGQAMKVGIQLSTVGWETPDDVEILLDGRPVPTSGIYTEDRSFFKVEGLEDLGPGRHQLQIREKIEDGDNVLASVRVTAFEPGYDFTPDRVGAFPTFDASGRQAGFRPTHESCLMRDMRTLDFCEVDQENMWRRFLDRVSLIDGVEVSEAPVGGPQVKLQTPALGGLEIAWYAVGEDGRERRVERLDGLKEWTPGPSERGRYRVEVRFHTDEVRNPTDRFTASKTLTV